MATKRKGKSLQNEELEHSRAPETLPNCYLTQINLEKNTSKFYRLKIERYDKTSYSVIWEWGRIGGKGANTNSWF